MFPKDTKFHDQRQRTLLLTVLAIASVSVLVPRAPVPTGKHDKGQETVVHEVNRVRGEES